jgi:hypothetical protein
MSRENDFYTVMIADATLVAILTGGAWKKGVRVLRGSHVRPQPRRLTQIVI